jgi:hypothetical protein
MPSGTTHDNGPHPLQRGDFCISPEKVHSRLPRAFVGVRIDHQGFGISAYTLLSAELIREESDIRQAIR